MDTDSDDNLIDEDELGHNLPNNFNFSFTRRNNVRITENRTKYRTAQKRSFISIRKINFVEHLTGTITLLIG